METLCEPFSEKQEIKMINETIMEKWVHVFNETFKNNSKKVLYLIWVQAFQDLIIKNCVKFSKVLIII